MKTRSVVIQICEIHQKTIWPRPYRYMLFHSPASAPGALYHPGARFWLQQLRHIGDCVPTPMRALSHSVREKFFLFSKNNPIKLFPGGIALLISTRTLHQTSGARDEVVLINQSRMHFLVQITNAVQEKSWLESFQKQYPQILKNTELSKLMCNKNNFCDHGRIK
jgi:hypothetical protein